MREDGRDRETSWALYVHEKASWTRYQLLELVFARFGLRRRVEEVNCENLHARERCGQHRDLRAVAGLGRVRVNAGGLRVQRGLEAALTILICCGV